MSFTNDDASDLLEQLAQTRTERDAMSRALIEHAGALAAAEYFGDPAYGALVADSLAVNVDDKGRASVKVVDSAGRARTKFDTNTRKFAAFTTADLAAEITSRWPQLAKSEKPASVDDKAADTANLTEQMRRQREEPRKATTAPLSDAERTAARTSNPWAPGTFNLTEAMRIERRDPAFAAVLKGAANVAA